MEGNKNNQHQEKVALLDEFFERILCISPVIATGRDGIVLRVDLSNLSPEMINALNDSGIELLKDDEYAVKMLKIYRPGTGEKEYNTQMTAYNLLNSLENVAKVPKPIILKVQHLSEADKSHLKLYLPFVQDDAELILMDYVDGNDLATIIYDFILAGSNYDKVLLENMEFQEKQLLVAKILNLETPNNSNPGNFIELVALRDNLRKIMNYLKRNGFHIDQSALDKIHNALKVLESNKIFHNDLHERNVMLDRNGNPFLIDFGRAVFDKNNQGNDDFAIIRRYSVLNQTESENRNRWFDFIKEVSYSEKHLKIVEKWKNHITNGEGRLVFYEVLSSAADDTDYIRALGYLLYIYNNSNEKTRSGIKEILDDLGHSLSMEHRKAILRDLRKNLD